MTVPVKQRMRKWRQRKTEAGGRSLSIWISAETITRLDALREHFGLKYGGKWTLTRLIEASVKALHRIATDK